MGEMNIEQLPMDTPAAVKEMIASCLDRCIALRPSIEQMCACLETACHEFDQKKLFLSYAWGKNDCRKPLADAIYRCLVDAGYSVWIDSLNMGVDLNRSMTQGIESSSIVVVLFLPDYVQSRACDHELREANRLGKPIVVCMVEPLSWREWKKADGSGEAVIAHDSEFIELAKLTKQLYADCSEACAVEWSSATSEQRMLLTHGEKAMPMLLSLLSQAASTVPALHTT